MARIPLEHAPRWIMSLEGRFAKAAENGLLSAAHRVVGIIQNEIIPAEPRVPVDRGIYRGGWRVRRESARAVIVANATPVAAIIEDGARAENIRPGREMIEALAGWVKRKGLTGAAKGVERAAEATRIAWAIAKSMQKNGIFNKGKGLKILAKALKRAPHVLEEEVKREIAHMKMGE